MNTVQIQVIIKAPLMRQLVYLHFIMPRKKGLITKECIVANAYLHFTVKRALHFRILAIKLFNSGAKLFLAAIATLKL